MHQNSLSLRESGYQSQHRLVAFLFTYGTHFQSRLCLWISEPHLCVDRGLFQKRKTTTVGPMRCINQVQSAVKLALAVSTSRTSNRPARDGDRAKKDSSACRVAPSALSLGLSGNGLAFNLVGSMCRARSTPHLREDAVGMPGRDRAACTACASRVETLRQF